MSEGKTVFQCRVIACYVGKLHVRWLHLRVCILMLALLVRRMPPYSGYDPVLRLLRNYPCRTIAQTLLWSLLIYGVLLYGSGAVVSSIYAGNTPIVGVFDFPERYTAAFVHWLYLPIVWVVFVLEPDWLSGVVASLRDNDVIGESRQGAESGAPSIDGYEEKLLAWFNNPWWVWISAAACLLLGGIFVLFLTNVSGSVWSSLESYWWSVNPWYFGLWLLLVVCLGYYMLFVAAFRAIAMAWWLRRLFRTFRAKVHPTHEDGCGGLGAVGRFAALMALFAFLAGMWIVTLSANNLIVLGRMGASPLYSLVPLYPLYAVWIVVFLVLLIVPMSSAHSAMKAEKLRRLALLRDELDTYLKGIDPGSYRSGSIEEIGYKMFMLKQIREEVEGYPEWPWKLDLAQKAGLFAMSLLPPISSASITIAARVFGLVPGN